MYVVSCPHKSCRQLCPGGDLVALLLRTVTVRSESAYLKSFSLFRDLLSVQLWTGN